MAAGGRRHLASTSVDTWTPLKQKKCRREVSTPSVQLKNSSKTAPRRAVGEKNKAFRRRHLASTLRNAGGPSVDAKCRASPAVAPLRRWWLIESRHRCWIGYGENGAERLVQRNGLSDRTRSTRAGTVELRIPKLRRRSTGASCRPQSGQATLRSTTCPAYGIWAPISGPRSTNLLIAGAARQSTPYAPVEENVKHCL